MKTIKCLVVDDEPLALKIIENYIQKIDNLELVASVRDAIEAFNILQKEKVDLMFLDIQMPQITGLDFAKNLSHSPKIIFTTAHREYAVESYELEAIDYLLKPISFERFMKAIFKVNMLLMDDSASETLKQEVEKSPETAYIYLKADNKTFKIQPNDILFIESFKDYVEVHLHSAEKLTCYQAISHFEGTLSCPPFLRIHRSFLVNINQIQSFNASYIQIKDFDLPIGRTYKNKVSEILASPN